MRAVILLVLMTIGIGLNAQTIRQTLGVRGGVTSGISYTMFKSEFKALEVNLGYRSGGIQFTALIETYRPLYLKHTDRVYFYSGLGAHVGYIGWHRDGILNRNLFRKEIRNRKHYPVLGLDGILGVEYRFNEIPIIVGVDYKPFLELLGPNFFNINIWDFGFAIKYMFN